MSVYLRTPETTSILREFFVCVPLAVLARRPRQDLFKLAVTVHQCLNGRAPPYLSEHCIPVSSADTRRHLRSANRHLHAVPRFRLNTYGRRAFSVAGPMAWNSIPDFIRDPTSSTDCLGVYLKRTCSRVTSASSALGFLNDYALYKSTHSLGPPLTSMQHVMGHMPQSRLQGMHSL